MSSSLVTRILALMQQILEQSGSLRSELRRLDQAGLGHRRMRDICDLLDTLDSDVHWDLRDELRALPGGWSPQAGRIVAWLDADIGPLEHLICRIEAESPGHPLVAAATTAIAEIAGRIKDVSQVLAAALPAPLAARGAGPAWLPPVTAAEPSHIC